MDGIDVRTLLRWRRSKGWSQKRLAEEAGVSLKTVVRIENGQGGPTLKSAIAVCRALGIGTMQVMEFYSGRDEA